VRDLGSRNRALLEHRDALQRRIDEYHRSRLANRSTGASTSASCATSAISNPSPRIFRSAPENVDDEMARIAGPQLVVPVSNARYALNAANARWGSLYDALYGTDAIPTRAAPSAGAASTRLRGERVVARARQSSTRPRRCRAAATPTPRPTRSRAAPRRRAHGAGATGLARPDQFVGFAGDAAAPSAVLLRNNNLHLEITIDRTHRSGRDDPAGVADVVLESAVTTIMDLEDSVAAVDAEDKVEVYRNWLGLMKARSRAASRRAGRPSSGGSTPTGSTTRRTAASFGCTGAASCWCATAATT
jgi:malate synthase